jgi:hypothetical protein
MICGQLSREALKHIVRYDPALQSAVSGLLFRATTHSLAHTLLQTLQPHSLLRAETVICPGEIAQMVSMRPPSRYFDRILLTDFAEAVT